MRPSIADGISASKLTSASAPWAKTWFSQGLRPCRPGYGAPRNLLAELCVRGLGLCRPYDLRGELAVGTLLPLDVDHVVRDLLAVGLRVRRELRASEEGHDVGLVERRSQLGGVGRSSVLERALEDEARGEPPGRVVRGRAVEHRAVRAGEAVAGDPVERDVERLRRGLVVFHRDLPLRGADGEVRGVADVGEGRLRRSDEERDEARANVLLLERL